MTVAGRINLMVVSTASVMALLILTATGIREYFLLRDSLISTLTTEITRETALAADLQLRERRTLHDFLAVSYTHLTLPTICSV